MATAERNYIWIWIEGTGVFCKENVQGHANYFKGFNKAFDGAVRGYAAISKDKQLVKLSFSPVVPTANRFYPERVVKYFQDNYPGYEIDKAR